MHFIGVIGSDNCININEPSSTEKYIHKKLNKLHLSSDLWLYTTVPCTRSITSGNQKLEVTLGSHQPIKIIKIAEKLFSISTLQESFDYIYYHQTDSHLIFTNWLPLIDHFLGKKPQINYKKILSLIDHNYFDLDSSYLENASVVAPGGTLTFKQNIVEISYPSISLGEFESLTQSINNITCTLQNSIHEFAKKSHKNGIFLSGGLDSSLLAAIFSSITNEKSNQLYSFTSAPEIPGGSDNSRYYDDERKYINILTKKYKNISENYISPSSHLISFENSSKTALSLGSPISAVPTNYHWIYTIFCKSAAMKVDTLFTGSFGNCSISWTPSNRHSISPLTLIKYHLSKTRQKLPNTDGDIFLHEKQRSIHEIFNGEWKYNHLMACERGLKILRFCFEAFNTLQIHFGTRIYDPMANPKLINLALSIPDHFYSNKFTDRRIIRMVGQDLLPKEVSQNTRRGIQYPEWPFLLRPYCRTYLERLHEYKLNPFLADHIDYKKLRSLLISLSSSSNSMLRRNKRTYGKLARQLQIADWVLFFNEYWPLQE